MATQEGALRQQCGDATRAFLQKEYMTSLLMIERGVELACADSRQGITHDVVLLERLLVLRYTAMVTVYTNSSVRERVMNSLEHTPESPEDAHARAHAVLQVLQAPAGALYTMLWYASLDVLHGTPNPPYPHTLDPSEELTPLILRVPGALLTSAILAALRLDTYASKGPAYARGDAETSARATCARQTCEWYFSALLTPDGQEVSKAGGTYERVLRIYTLQVLGVHLQDWNYAHDFVGYSSLPEDAKLALFGEIDAMRQEIDARAKREREALQEARAQYEEEKKRRAQAAHDEAHKAPAPSVVPTDEPAPAPAPVEQDSAPTALPPPPARPSGASLQRTPSIRRKGRTARASAEDDAASHAATREHLQTFLARRPTEEPAEVPRGLSYGHVRHMLFSYVTRKRVLILLLALATLAGALAPRAASSRRPSLQSWPRVAIQRLWDTLRMYVFSLQAPTNTIRGTQVTYL